MKIYLDACCYNRPFDDRTQNRVFDEANAILSIIKRAEDADIDIVGSSILDMRSARLRMLIKAARLLRCIWRLSQLKSIQRMKF